MDADRRPARPRRRVHARGRLTTQIPARPRSTPTLHPPTTSAGRWTPSTMRATPTTTASTTATGRSRGGSVGHHHHGERGGDGAVPGDEPQPRTRAVAHVEVGEERDRARSSDHVLDHLGHHPGARPDDHGAGGEQQIPPHAQHHDGHDEDGAERAELHRQEQRGRHGIRRTVEPLGGPQLPLGGPGPGRPRARTGPGRRSPRRRTGWGVAGRAAPNRWPPRRSRPATVPIRPADGCERGPMFAVLVD